MTSPRRPPALRTDAALGSFDGLVAPDRDVRYLEHVPGRSLLVQYGHVDGHGDGGDGELVAVVDADASHPSEFRYPADPGLPALQRLVGAAAAADCANVLAATGVDAARARVGTPMRLAWVPRQRATLQFGHVVVKCHRTGEEAAAAARSQQFAASYLPSPEHLGHSIEFATTAQGFLAGRQLERGDALTTALAAGRLLAVIAGGPIARGDSAGSADAVDAVSRLSAMTPADLLALTETPVAVVAHALPELTEPLHTIVERLGDTMPDRYDLVVAHGDFNLSQLLERDGELLVVDTDTMCRAPDGYDLAGYVANVLSGRGDDLDDARAATRLLVDGYGARPDHLDWLIAVSTLRRVDRPIRRRKKRWPDRTVAMVEAARVLADAVGSW